MSASVKHEYAVRYADGRVFPEGNLGEAIRQARWARGRPDPDFAGAHVVQRTVTVSDWGAAA